MTRDGVGFVCPNGGWLYASNFKPLLHPYFFWSASCNKEARHAAAQIGLHGVKEFLRSWEKQELRMEMSKWESRESKPSHSGSSTPTKRKRG
ncbi:hypothetical protein SUGI_1154810 [Cryptomeria japonica]|nr:hypothetical protein SUGI_1154810 [Cryptomeria japonica]